uniref:PH domain-containing protein n=1 Tax=Globisporangium ultimum (strain ATCC 200006 / CBS 805.95 / DAOM BR144) TaxID=431595 RepID=K3WV84_GLOUD
MAPDDDARGDDDVNVLLKAIAKQEQVLRSMQSAHGEFHPSVSEDLAQLALLYNMNSEFDKALPLLHKRLVIHEKYGPDELTGETLQDLGTIYRLHGVHEVALQHLERALTIRERCHGKDSLKVAETLNSLALVNLVRSEPDQAEAFQLRSLQVLFDSTEPEDIESEDVPWEVYKRLKQQRGPSTAGNSVTLLKGNMRKCALEVLYSLSAEAAAAAARSNVSAAENALNADSQRLDLRTNANPHQSSPSPTKHADLETRRAVRSHSDGAMKRHLEDLSGMDGEFADRRSTVLANDTSADEHRDANQNELVDSIRINVQSGSSPTAQRHFGSQPPFQQGSTPYPRSSPANQSRMSPIRDFSTLQNRVEVLKRRITAGYPEADEEVARLVSDVDMIHDGNLREIAAAMVSLVREMNRLRIKSDSARSLPVLEGWLEKKSASIFRGWEKRWFKVDPKTFILSYHFNKDDYSRGFAPRGGFSVSRISNIIVHRHARGNHYNFDVVVDLSTRLNPHASRTYELRCEDQEALRYWVETLHYYKATAQTTPARPSTS